MILVRDAYLSHILACRCLLNILSPWWISNAALHTASDCHASFMLWLGNFPSCGWRYFSTKTSLIIWNAWGLLTTAAPVMVVVRDCVRVAGEKNPKSKDNLKWLYLSTKDYPNLIRRQRNLLFFLRHVMAFITKTLCAKFCLNPFTQSKDIKNCFPVPKITQIVTSSKKIPNLFMSRDGVDNKDPVCKVSFKSVYPIKRYIKKNKHNKKNIIKWKELCPYRNMAAECRPSVNIIIWIIKQLKNQKPHNKQYKLWSYTQCIRVPFNKMYWACIWRSTAIIQMIMSTWK